MSFQKRLKKLRLKNKLTQRDVANMLGITRQAYGYYESETSKREPDLASVKKLAEIFDVTADYLLGRSDKKENTRSSGLNDKDERDIAKRMKKMREDLLAANKEGDGLSFMGEPMSEEAIELLLEALEYAERIATLANKKYTPKKYRDKD